MPLKFLGLGGWCEDQWMFAEWNEEFIKSKDPSIEFLELYALTAGILNWVCKFRNRRIIIFCDNESVVQMLNSSSSQCKNCMVLIRLIILESLIQRTLGFLVIM